MNQPRLATVEALESRTLFSAPPTLAFAVTAGGPGKDRANDVAVDAAGNSYLAGVYNGPVDFDPSAAAAVLPGTGSDDAFLAKYSPAGRLLWAKALTGAGTQEIQSVAVDAGGNVVVTGYFDAAVDFDPGPGVHKLASRGGEDAFVLKLSAAGGFVWARQFGGAGREGGVSVATDRGGGVYVQGMFNAAGDYGPTPGAARLSPAGGFDDFVVKLSSTGALAFARRVGGTGDEFANGVVADNAGNVYTVGTFTGTADFDPGAGAAPLTSAGGTDVFLSKLSPTGGYLSAKRIGGKGTDNAGDVRVDAAGNVYVDGDFTGTADFDPGPGTSTLTSVGISDAFVAKYTPAGQLAWARRVGGSLADGAADLAVEGGGNVFLTGWFSGTVDFDPGSGTYALTSHGGRDAFVAELSPGGAFVRAAAFGGTTGLDEGEGIALDRSGGVYVAGVFGGLVDFDPGPGQLLRSSLGGQPDPFLVRLVP